MTLWERAITDLVEIERRKDEENVTTAIIRSAGGVALLSKLPSGHP